MIFVNQFNKLLHLFIFIILLYWKQVFCKESS